MDFAVLDARPLMSGILNELQAEAATEGVRNVARLRSEWNSGESRFDGDGECLLVAESEGHIVGVGGVRACNAIPGALRVSRFYVHPHWRRAGVATAIATECLRRARPFAAVITCNAQASASAGPFWESLGFEPTQTPGLTHILRR